MSSFEVKLKENRNRRAREAYLATVDPDLRSFIGSLEFSSDRSCLKNAAFSTWNTSENRQTSTRGDIDGWKNYTFSSWDKLVEFLKTIQAKDNVSGWFFVDVDGPYYSMSMIDFIRQSDRVARQSEKNDEYDFGWVGSIDDCGIIAEFNHTSMCRNDFELSVWGI